MIHVLLNASRKTKRTIALTYDALAIPCAVYLALALRHGSFFPKVTSDIYLALMITTAITIIAFIRLGLYRAVVRFMTGRAFTTLTLGIGISVITLATASFLIPASIPRSSVIIYFFT